jgi:hypothetical protein
MSRRFALLRLVWLLAVLLGPQAVLGQEPLQMSMEDPQFLSFGSGDIHYRTFTYASLVGQTVPSMYFVPDEGLPADIYVATVDRKPGWVQMVNKLGWNGFATDWVGCGGTEEPPDRDLVKLTEKAIWGVYQMGIASGSDLMFARGLGCAFLIKAVATDERLQTPAILLDPIGPRGAQPRMDLTPEDLIEQQKELRERKWVQWGFGPRYGKLYDHVDLTAEDFELIYDERFEPDQPRYWVNIFTGFDGDFEVREPVHLKGWPVLVVRSPHRSKEEIAREESVIRWLQEREVRVERMELTDIVEDITALPMLGPHAETVLNSFIEWGSQFGSSQ